MLMVDKGPTVPKHLSRLVADEEIWGSRGTVTWGPLPQFY